MEAFDEEDIFRTAYIDLLNEFSEIVEDYDKLLDMWADEDVTQEEYNDFVEEIDDNTEEAWETFDEKQKDFANQYDFTIEEVE
jgi:predicted DNA-binding protein YlxM (UPF0122 family)